jgi:succinate dehydrogenase / fumarate reductase cytochrome b subunit
MKLNGRHIYLNLLQIRLPIAGVMSIAHRVSGVLMVLAIPLLIGLLQFSLADAASFGQLKAWFGGWLGLAILFLALWALLHHLLAGIRYFLLDLDIGIDKPHYRHSAWGVMLAAPLLAALLTGVMR